MLQYSTGAYLNPNAKATRATAVLWTARFADKTYYGWTPAEIPWTDLSASDPYAYAFLIAYNNEVYVEERDEDVSLLEGYKDGTVGPHKSISRAEVVAFLDRVATAWYPEVLE
jgi:hypothetical protein